MKFPRDTGENDDQNDGEGSYKRLKSNTSDCCDHAGHDHHHGDTPKPGGLRGLFQHVANAYNKHSARPSALLAVGALLSTTAFTTPAMSTLLGAGTIMAGALWLLKKSSDLTLAHVGALGQKKNIGSLYLGLGLSALTAIPEAGVAIMSLLHKTADIGIATLVGSNVAHSLLVLGAVAAITPIARGIGQSWKFNTLAMAGVTSFFAAQLATNTMSWPAAARLGLMTGGYIAGLNHFKKKDAVQLGKPVEDLIHHHGPGSSCHHNHNHSHDHDRSPNEPAQNATPLKNAFYTTAGVGGLALAADLVVRSATASAGITGLNDAAMSSLIVSFGAVLPELAMNIKAARNKDTEFAVGNILGCNIFNVLLVAAAMSAVGVTVPGSLNPSSSLGVFNLTALGVSGGLMTTTLLAQQGAMKKWQGYAALGLYGAYLAGTIALGKAPDAPVAAIHQEPPAIYLH